MHLRRSPRAATLGLAAMLLAALAADAVAIEMFTYFGDGSRIGLPSLEVPIEAYPGIPLRSDRIRARRAARGMATAPAGVTVRSMPPLAPPPRPVPRRVPAPRRPATVR